MRSTTTPCTKPGALRAFAEAAGGRLQHVKPHGAFYTMSAADEALAAALVRAVEALGDGVVLYGMGEIEPALAKQVGVGYVREGYVDLNYDDSGGLVLERNKGAWDPEEVARRAVRLATRDEVGTVEGNTLALAVQSICIHGDAPNSGEVARRVRDRLEAAGSRSRRSARNRQPSSSDLRRFDEGRGWNNDR